MRIVMGSGKVIPGYIVCSDVAEEEPTKIMKASVPSRRSSELTINEIGVATVGHVEPDTVSVFWVGTT